MLTIENRAGVDVLVMGNGCRPASEAESAFYAEVQRLRDALEYLIEKCGESDDAQYGTLGTRFVRNIARRALEGK